VRKMAKKWSKKYKRSIDCNNPKGFSQKAHCAGRKKRESVMTSLNEDKLQRLAFGIIKDLNSQFPKYNPKRISDFNKVTKYFKSKMPRVSNIKLGQIALDYHNYRQGDMGVKIPTIKKMAHTMRKVGVKEMKEGLDDLKALPKDLKKSIKKNRNEVFFESITEDGMTTNHIYYEIDGKGYGYTLEFVNELNEAEYQGRKVKLGKIMQGDQKKFKVYVKNPKGNVVKVNFGQGGDAKGGTMRIRKSNPKARASFRARHNCDNPGPRHKARYWSCRKW